MRQRHFSVQLYLIQDFVLQLHRDSLYGMRAELRWAKLQGESWWVWAQWWPMGQAPKEAACGYRRLLFLQTYLLSMLPLTMRLGGLSLRLTQVKSPSALPSFERQRSASRLYTRIWEGRKTGGGAVTHSRPTPNLFRSALSGAWSLPLGSYDRGHSAASFPDLLQVMVAQGYGCWNNKRECKRKSKEFLRSRYRPTHRTQGKKPNVGVRYPISYNRESGMEARGYWLLPIWDSRGS